jgi:hypothetical protein
MTGIRLKSIVKIPADIQGGDGITVDHSGGQVTISVDETTLPSGLNWRGNWNNVTTYEINDGVANDGASYIAIAENLNAEPPGADWDLLAQSGSTVVVDDQITPPMLDADTAPKQLAFRDRLNFVSREGDTLTGHLVLPTGPAASNAVRKDYVDATDALRVAKAGDTMTGHLVLPITPAASNAVRRDYVDTAAALKVAKLGDTMTGTLGIEPPTATDTPGFLIVQDGATTGGPYSVSGIGGLGFAYNSIWVRTDQRAQTAPGQYTFGLHVYMDAGGANAQGSKYALQAQVVRTANDNPAVSAGDTIAACLSASSFSNNGGVSTAPGGYRGSLYGSAHTGYLNSGATNYGTVCGAEMDVGIFTGASSYLRMGTRVVSHGNLHASTHDAAVGITSTSSLGWKNGVYLCSVDGGVPIASTGAFIGTDGAAYTMRYGINLANCTFTDYFIYGTGFYVSSNWAVVVGGSTTPQIQWVPTSGATYHAQVYQTGDYWQVAQAGGTIAVAVDLASSNFYCNGNGFKPGGGDWGVISDSRVKTVVGDYGSGLAAINQLRPVRYTYKGNDTNVPPSNTAMGAEPSKEAVSAPYLNSPHYQVAVEAKEFIGLVAQDTEGPMPECVVRTDGHIDGQPVADMRSLDSGPIIFALINCVKELVARIEALEAKA